jgi:hypothetical protein
VSRSTYCSSNASAFGFVFFLGSLAERKGFFAKPFVGKKA